MNKFIDSLYKVGTKGECYHSTLLYFSSNFDFSVEKAKAKTEEELEENQTNKTELRHLEGDLEDLRGQLETSRDKLSEVQRELSKEKLKNRSASRHTEVCPGGRGNLLETFDFMHFILWYLFCSVCFVSCECTIQSVIHTDNDSAATLYFFLKKYYTTF